MFKSLLSEKGSTLLLVMATVLMLSILVVPMVLVINSGFLQTKDDERYEQASELSESAALVFQKLLRLTVNSANDATANRALVESLKTQMENKSMLGDTAISVQLVDGVPAKVVFNSKSGTGSLEREKSTPLNILAFPKGVQGGGTGPTQNSTGNEFYYKFGAVLPSYYNVNNAFAYCGPTPAGQTLISNTYITDNSAAFSQAFTSYTDYYLGSNFTTNMSNRLQPMDFELAPITMPTKVSQIAVNTSDNWSMTDSATGVFKGGNVSAGNWVDNITINGGLIAGGNIQSGNFRKQLHIKGDVLAKGSINLTTSNGEIGLVIEGDIVSPTNISISNMNKVTIMGSILAGGTLTISGVTELTINGTVTAGGNITLGGITKYSSAGSLQAGGNITLNQGFSNGFSVGGTMAANAIDFNTYSSSGLISIGKWTSGGAIDDNDNSSLIAKTSLHFRGNNHGLRVTGNVSAATFPSAFNAYSVNVGGHFISGGDLSIQLPNPWKIAKSLNVGGRLIFQNTVLSMIIGGSVYAVNGVVFQSTIGDNGGVFQIGGSLYSGGEISAGNTANGITIAGDLVVKNNLNFVTLRNITVQGSVIASGNITFSNELNNITVGGSLMSNGDISFQHILTKFEVGGLLGALKNINFNNHLNTATKTFGGFYTGGTVKFPEAQYHNNSIGTICIKPNIPSSGGAGGSTELQIG